MKKLLIILGPTSTGKTDLALKLAKKFNGELVSCDSRQVYIGLDIGTGKLPSKNNTLPDKLGPKVKSQKYNWEIDGIKVWMYDVTIPTHQYSVFDYIKDARQIIYQIDVQGKLPILVGGTGYYLKALLEGIENLKIPPNLKVREELKNTSLKKLQERLKKLNPEKWNLLNNSDKNNPRRLLRYIEIFSMNPYVRKSQNSNVKSQKYETLKIGLTAPREFLNKQIDLRLDSRISQGLIEEGKLLHKKGLSFRRMKELGLEYAQLTDLLEGKINEDKFKEVLKIKIHQYAKRQMTWFKKDKQVHWLDITNSNYYQKVEELVIRWYYQH